MVNEVKTPPLKVEKWLMNKGGGFYQGLAGGFLLDFFYPKIFFGLRPLVTFTTIPRAKHHFIVPKVPDREKNCDFNDNIS